MIVCSIRDLSSFCVVAIICASLSLSGENLSPTTDSNDACALLTPADIAKATSLKVGDGTAGKPIPGVLGRCSWTGEGNTKVIVTLGDAQHIGLTVAAAEQTGGESVPGLGTKAVVIEGAAFTGGGYVINVLDAKGGFGVSILGKDGTRVRAIALAKIIETQTIFADTTKSPSSHWPRAIRTRGERALPVPDASDVQVDKIGSGVIPDTAAMERKGGIAKLDRRNA